MTEIWSTGIRMMTPSSRTSSRSSSSVVILRHASPPVLSVAFMARMPLPPRPCSANWLSSVRLPRPFSVTVRTSPSLITRIMSMTTSPSSRRIERTPMPPRPVARTLLSRKRMHLPLRDAMMNSSSPQLISTEISSSPSRTVCSTRPPFRIFMHSAMRVFLMRPSRVAVTRYPVSSTSRGTMNIAVTFSPVRSCKRFTTGMPFEVRLASGIA